MSHRYTPLEIMPTTQMLTAKTSTLALGSCFSDNIGTKLQKAGFATVVNPGGILYNPISIATAIQNATDQYVPTISDVHSRDGVFFHFDYHSDMSRLSAKEVVVAVTKANQALRAAANTANLLLITLGTAIVHTRKADGAIVANCHKMPGELFDKRMLSVTEMVNDLSEAVAAMSNANVVITVSPIRHTREGLVQNQLSKARLLQSAHQLCTDHEHVHYFPAYEIMMDELRDYRYYTADMIHPTDEAIDIIWKKFQSVYFDSNARKKAKDVSALLSRLWHRPLLPQGEAHRKFLSQTDQLLQELLIQYPEINPSIFEC